MHEIMFQSGVKEMSERSELIPYHYTNLTFVCESGRSREAIRPELKRFPTLHRWTWTLHEAAH